ncbi:nucleotidyltransferase domain-containing protein [Peribacillus sp. NPDC094092]|uniref:nucleotidyltransferase domain-containing protein n=1 Tax=Peribacillus sp. NPDC094092 TaxID=3390611 RepID=UPI003CFC5228
MDYKEGTEENDTSKSQLNILLELNEICLSRNFDVWLRGGWAIDFLLGKITRSHSDIDLVTWIQYREHLEQALVHDGFQIKPVSEFQTDFLKNDVDVSFVFVRYSDNGDIVANGFPDWVWRKDALPLELYNLQGISINVLNPYQLLEEKKVHEQGTGRTLRPKDLKSMEMIQQIIDAKG